MLLIKELNKDKVGDKITLAGWLRTKRDSKGGFSFLEINDGSTFTGIQVVADDNLDNYSDIKSLHTGASLKVSGKLVESPGAKQAYELQADNVVIYGNTDQSYLLQKGRINFETLRESAHLRCRTNSIGAVMRVRNVLSKATHDFFQSRHFLNLHTPIITASDCEGAGEMFQVTTLDLDKLPKTDLDKVDYKKDFFGKQTHLTVSGQLNGESYACGMGRIYTFGPTFRAENSNTSRHLSEFWMVEPEAAFFELKENADLARDYLKYCFKSVVENAEEDLKFFDQRIEKGIISKLELLSEAEFTRITYTEAVKILEKSSVKFEFPVKWGIDLQSEHERFLTEKVFKQPVIVTDYPKDIKAFYMKLNDDEKTVRAMDVLCPQIGEIIGGSQREENLDVLLARMKNLEIDPQDYSWYLDLRRYGSVPHSGFGLGFERLVQFCTGMSNIRDVIPFPRTPKNAKF
ncbi:asparagine--tRNA ligase [Lentisphaera profundi]|uniref:Asparagine--tRNA ligase n=1 Tax=Lentisphaera profundi TaxID=1658616 RepID=A0ABY7VTW3_9BACT|nr:asparagine--tRNA ligase [Lentisphaera profundi]WDE96266.1 asparagine--tRNA ligase [Lentisphaera profundi]